MPTELHVVVTPAGVAVAFLGLVVFTAVVFLAGVLSVMWPQRSRAEECADTERAEAVELPSRRLPPPRTASTIHAPQYRRSDEDTVVIEPAETRR